MDNFTANNIIDIYSDFIEKKKSNMINDFKLKYHDDVLDIYIVPVMSIEKINVDISITSTGCDFN